AASPSRTPQGRGAGGDGHRLGTARVGLAATQPCLRPPAGPRRTAPVRRVTPPTRPACRRTGDRPDVDCQSGHTQFIGDGLAQVPGRADELAARVVAALGTHFIMSEGTSVFAGGLNRV